MSRRKKKKEEVEINESWLLPYADLLTLLLALFIVLFSMSAVDANKFQQLSQVFNGIFSGGDGIFNFPEPAENDSETDGKQSLEEQLMEQEKIKEELLEKLGAEDLHELETIQMKVNTYVNQNKYDQKFDIKLTSEGLLITIMDNVLFESGKADVRKEDRETAVELAELLSMDPPRNIIISGHTDNVPIKNSNFSSNWELSVMRAVNFMSVLIEEGNLDPKWFSAKGFGEFEPVADNDIPAGRSKNRRVEVLVLPRTE